MGVSITAFVWEIALFEYLPAFQLKCHVFCVFRIESYLFELFCVFTCLEIIAASTLAATYHGLT